MISVFDIFVFLILFVSSLTGLYRGLIYIVVNLLGFIASIFVAIFLYNYVYIILTGYIAGELATSIVSAIVSYIFSLVVFTLLASKVVSLFKDISKGGFDRVLGFLVGIIRGILICLLIFSVIAIFTTGTYTEEKRAEDVVNNLDIEKYPNWLKNSITTVYLDSYLKKSVDYIPQSWLDSIELDNNEENSDRINEIKKRKKMNIKSSLQTTIDENLEKDIDEILPKGENDTTSE